MYNLMDRAFLRKTWIVLKNNDYAFDMQFRANARVYLCTDDAHDDRHSDGDEDNPRFKVLKPGPLLRSLRRRSELASGYVQTIARFL